MNLEDFERIVNDNRRTQIEMMHNALMKMNPVFSDISLVAFRGVTYEI